MQVDLSNILNLNDKVGVAVSGGCDSMCLLHFLRQNAQKYNISVLAVNVEHGIRGESSINDTNFVKNYCKENAVPFLTFSVDAPKFANENKLSLEQAARILRYECFEEVIKSGKCNKIATAHHQDDNVETVLFNLFRGTGLKGLTGIVKERRDGIIRPFLSLSRIEIEDYAKANNIPFVTDETNLKDDYTRNFIRHNITPKIKQIFPEVGKSVERLSSLILQDEEFINSEAEKLVSVNADSVSVALPCHNALLSRAVIKALKAMGVKKDWEKAHVDSVITLAGLCNGSKASLVQGITAIKEYDKIVFYRECSPTSEVLDFRLGEFEVFNTKLVIKEESLTTTDLKSGLFADLDKIPKTAVIRARKEGDLFTKFGGGTKSLNDYFTDKKLPLRQRDDCPLIADGNQVLAIFGLAISDKIKVDKNTTRLISFKILD